MAISVVCSGCQSQYTVPDNLAGKRAKCKKCGAAIQVPAPVSSGEGLFDDLDTPALTPLPNPKPQPKPKAAAAANPYADSSLDDVLGLSAVSTSPSPLAVPTRHAMPVRPAGAAQPRSGASIGAAIAATLLSLCGAGVIFFALLCTTDYILAFIIGGLGIVAAIACCTLGIMRMPGLSWSVFALYSFICVLGIGKAGYNVYLLPTRVRELAEKERLKREGNVPAPPNRTWTPPTPTNNNPLTPSWPTPSNNNNNPTVKPWTPPSAVPEDLKQPRTDDWKVTLDPPPDWAKIGEGRDFSLVLDQPGWNPIKHSSGYATAVGFQHQLGGQDVFEVWDLAKRRKVGQLKGKNGFQGEFSLSPDGKYVAGEVREDGRFGSHGPIQVWSIAGAAKVCEIAAPSNDRDVDILDYAGPETLLGVYRRGDNTMLKVWNISDGSEKLTVDLGKEQVDRRRYALSPGRKYFVAFDNQVIRFFDLISGSAQGIIYLPSGYRCEAFSFSPDGTEFAAVCDVDWKANVVVWQTMTGEMKSQVKIEHRAGELVDGAEKIGGLAIGWLTSGEGWLLGGKKAISRKDGTVLWTVPGVGWNETPPKLVDADQMISIEKVGNSSKVTMRPFPYGEMDSVNKALAAGGAAIDSKLPPLGKADYSAVKELDWTPVSAWNVAPDARPNMKAGTGNKPITLTADRLQGVAFSSPSQAQVVTLDVDQRSPEHTELSPQVASYLSRFDLQTGKSAVRQKVPGGSQLMAISPSGTRAAVTIGSDEGRVDVYSLAERGQLLCAWRPYLEENPKVEGHSHSKQHSRQSIQWSGFVDEDHLLTINRFDGQLVLWKLPEMKAVYRLRSGTGGGGALSPGGKYVLVRGKDRLTLIEAKTGTIAGELPIPFEITSNDEDLSAAFSSDGSRLAVTVPDVAGAFLLAFDLKSGKELARMPVGYRGDLQWCGPRQLLIGGERSSGGGVRLIDLDRRATVWRYAVLGGYRLNESPDDRVWLIAGGYHQADAVLVAQPFQLSTEVTTAIGTLPFNPQPVFGPGTSVSIDSTGVGSAGSSDLAERVKQMWSTTLAARGARVGEGGVKLVASTSSGASRTEEYTPSRFGGFPFPGRSSPTQSTSGFSFTTTDINLLVQLQDSGGKTLWETKSVASYHLPYSVQSTSADKSPQQIMSDNQAAAHKSGTEGFFLGVRLPFMIYPQPVDKDGQPGLGSTMINLTGYVRQQTGPRPIDADTAGAKEAFQGMYQQVLTDNSDATNNHWQWCQGLDRPVVAIRWAIGIQMDMRSERAKVELSPKPVDNAVLRDLERSAGPIGPALVQMLRSKQSEGKFGTFAGIGDDKLREVIVLGTGERAQLALAARKAAVDVVLIVKLEPIVKGRQRDAQLSLEVLDLASGKKLWNSESILESRVKAAKLENVDLLGELSERMGEDIDSKLGLTALETMPAGTPALRAEASVLHRANPLAALAEIDLYLCREKIPAVTASSAFAKVLGNTTDAADLASENAKTREAAIEKVVGILVDKMQ